MTKVARGKAVVLAQCLVSPFVQVTCRLELKIVVNEENSRPPADIDSPV